eukprot:gene26914-32523_t
MCLPFISAKVTFVVYVVNVIVAISGISYLGATSAIVWFALGVLISSGICYVHTTTQMQLFKYSVRSRVMHQQREDMERLKTAEIKSVLGKISHDLKTPLTSLSYGLESMDEIMQSSTIYPHSNPAFDELKQTLDGLQMSHTYLTVILNRCLDYHKLANSLPLVPRYAPVSVRQVLQQGLRWASKVYERRQVVVERFDLGGGDSVISDPSWLRENFLCLLSNGLKYSEDGPVKVRIIKQKEEIRGVIPVVDSPFVPSPRRSQTSRRVLEGSSGILRKTNSTPLGIIRENSESFDIEEGVLAVKTEEPDYPDDSSSDAAASPHMHDMLRVEVEDFGNGLSEDMARNFFSPPANIEERSMGGTGLGLYCVAERVKALGGNCGVIANLLPCSDGVSKESIDAAIAGLSDVKSDDTRGTVVWFSIPFQAASPVSSYGSADMSEMVNASLRVASNPEENFCEAMPQKEEGRAYADLPTRRSLVGSYSFPELSSVDKFSPTQSSLPSSISAKDPSYYMEVSLPSDHGDLQTATTPLSISFEDKEQPVGHSASKDLDPSVGLDASPPLEQKPEPNAVNSAEGGQANLPNPESTASSSAASVAMRASAATFSPPLKVLVVDDSGLILKVLKSTLQKRGHEVSVTTNGYEALDMIKKGWMEERDKEKDTSKQSESCPVSEQRPLTEKEFMPGAYDVMLLDVQMPIIDGLQVIRECQKMWAAFQSEKDTLATSSGERSDGESGSINYGPIIIAMSASGDPATMEAALHTGADFFFTKPFDVEAFHKVIKNKTRKRVQFQT